MNKAQKIIWTIYIGVLGFLIINLSNGYDAENTFVRGLIVGWIPTLILHLLWRDKKPKDTK